jgi:glycosyltransferase involved in cell wall biosynthesis
MWHPLIVWDWDVVSKVWNGRYDVLWVFGYYHPSLQLAMLTQIATRRALLFREEQTLLEPRPVWKTAIKQTWLRLLLTQARGLYIGQQNRRWLKKLGVPDSRLFHVPYCADNDHLRDEANRLRPDREAIRRRLGVPSTNTPVFLMVCRLIEKKQPGFVLEAFRRARAQTNCALLIVGSGDLRNELERQVARDSIPDVTFTGFMNRSEISAPFTAADAFVLGSSHDETWGIVINEAMNFGLPVVVTDKVGCAPDLVQEGHNGFVVSSTDPAQLSSRMVVLAESSSLRKAMGDASLDLVNRWRHEIAAEGAISAIAAAVGPRRWNLATRS